MLNFNTTQKTKLKISINIGALLDIPTGSLLNGIKGESIINGGLSSLTGCIGIGNNFKSTVMHYMMLSAANKVAASTDTAMITYDTEMNVSIDRLENLASRFEFLPALPIQGESAYWTITDKASIPGNKWALELNDYTTSKAKNKKTKVTYTGIKDPYTGAPLVQSVPTFVEIDSLSDFEAETTMDMLSHDLDTSDTNTFAMKQGLFKMKFLTQLPRMASTSETYFLMTAQLGEKIDMLTGPAKYNQPQRKLQYMKSTEKLVGVSPKFYYYLNNGWYAHTASVLKNKSTKLPEYPSGEGDMVTDLNTVKLTQLRGKNGPSGYTINIVVSQSVGVLPTLTEFHYIKENERFGLEGSLTSYSLTILPDVKLSRGTVYGKIETNEKLRRAINITAELAQMHVFHKQYGVSNLLCTPEELYNGLIDKGYDWGLLLDTRGYWLIDQYADNQKPFLSIIDLLKMNKGEYIPYWYPKDTLKDKS